MYLLGDNMNNASFNAHEFLHTRLANLQCLKLLSESDYTVYCLSFIYQCMIQWIGVLFLDWFEWDCLRLRLENVNVVTQQTQSSHINVYIWVLFILYIITYLKNKNTEH